ncbi:MAG: quinolinate synthase NadA [Myxococcota bacterium]
MTGTFPTLRITKDALIPEGSFAEAQAAFLEPDPAMVKELSGLLREKNIGIVAHFYMDPELQGVLSACDWPHIGVSDSLVMADRGIKMAEAGCRTVIVLGVDFMSENARALLTAAGHENVPVYRVASEAIGCSLAESAEAKAYGAYLAEAAKTPNALHVVYINTSLVTKAKAHARVPTITCTSSNVVMTILQAASQVPDVAIFFGPDTYMGENLKNMFEALATMDDEAIRALHPDHNQASIKKLLSNFRYFRQGNCVVHHMFGADVVQTAREEYPDAFVTAHLEVPGEMFALGLEKQQSGNGVVGSTSNILGFILGKVREGAGSDQALRFVLGTEAGMITPIVRQVQAILQEADSTAAAEIIFPVASEAVAQTEDSELPIVPGVAAGEGCTVAGGCATCPYMKMNSLQALLDLCRRIEAVPGADLASFEPKKYVERIDGRSAAELGGEPILHMRHFQQNGTLSKALVTDVTTRPGRSGEALTQE